MMCWFSFFCGAASVVVLSAVATCVVAWVCLRPLPEGAQERSWMGNPVSQREF